MKDRHAEFQQLGSDVLAVSFSPPERVARYLDESPMPFPVASDPSRAGYQAFGLERTTWGGILRPGVVGRYLGLILRGWLPHKTARNEDVLQLGGDFILNRRRRLVFARRSAEPTDRPSVNELLQAIRVAAALD